MKDANLSPLLEKFSRAAVGCNDEKAVTHLACDLVRLRASGFKLPILPLQHDHPMAPVLKDLLEQWKFPYHYVMV